MNTTPARPQHDANHRALVLGGGGSTGNAWLIGVVAGLCEAGLDVTDADLIVGTSAGATAAAQLAGASPAELLAAVLEPAPRPASAPIGAHQGRGQGPGPNRPVADHLDRLTSMIASAEDAADFRRRLAAAALALEADSVSDWSTQWRATVASRLPGQQWPQRTVLLTAIDAASGEPVVFDRHTGVELADAVAASCSSRLPFRIGDGRYLDGGYRSNAENADLATGHERVLVLSPLGGRSLTPLAWGTHLATQVEELRAGGSRVAMVFPDSSAEHLFGADAMDLSLRPAAARAGHDQGRALAEQLTDLWD